MSDNVAITEGAGTTISTDDVAGVHYQVVKLADGTADSATVIAADIGVKANALRVAPASDITDATYIGDIKFGEGLPANSGVDIGDVTINNAAAGSAVNIQDGGNSLTVDNGGTFSVQDSQVLADDAAFTIATTKVWPLGCLVDNTATDLADEGDAGIPRMTADRKQIVSIGEAPANRVSGTNSATTNGSTSVIAGVASTYIDVSTVIVHNSSATDTYVTLQDGTGGTALAVLPAPAKGGCVVPFVPALRVPTSGNGLFFAAGAGVTTMYVSASGYKSLA